MSEKKTDINELSEKVLEGMRKALKKLVESRARNNEALVIGDKNGTIQNIPAKDLLQIVQK